ncbi:hypothetical protein JCM10450v2_002321 [Rhodotorula kratochvilovae]
MNSDEEYLDPEESGEIKPTWEDYYRVVHDIVNYGLLQPCNAGRHDEIHQWAKAVAGGRAKARFEALSQGTREGVIATVETMRSVLCDTPAAQPLRLLSLAAIFPVTRAHQATAARDNTARKRTVRQNKKAAASQGGNEATPPRKKAAHRRVRSSQSATSEAGPLSSPLAAAPHGHASRPSRHGGFEPSHFPQYPMAAQQHLPNNFEGLHPVEASFLSPPQPAQPMYHPGFPAGPAPQPVPPGWSGFAPAPDPFNEWDLPVNSAGPYDPRYQQHQPDAHDGSGYPPNWQGGGGQQRFFSLGGGALGRRAARYYGTTPERWARGVAW